MSFLTLTARYELDHHLVAPTIGGYSQEKHKKKHQLGIGNPQEF